jgi:hypothetical protein
MTHSQDSTSPPTDDPRGIVDPNLVDAFRKLSTLKADYETKLLDYMEDCLLPVINAWRVAGGVEPAPPPNRPPVVPEELKALGEECQAMEVWMAELEAGFNEEPRPREPRGPRAPTLASVTKQAHAAGIELARIEIKPDRTITVVPGEPELADANNPWPTADLRKKK